MLPPAGLCVCVCVVQAELREEQQTYRQYLSDELQKQKREEEETEQLMEEKLKEVWTKREEQSRLQREARNRLMEEVMEARSLQIQHKRKKTECLYSFTLHQDSVLTGDVSFMFSDQQ